MRLEQAEAGSLTDSFFPFYGRWAKVWRIFDGFRDHSKIRPLGARLILKIGVGFGGGGEGVAKSPFKGICPSVRI